MSNNTFDDSFRTTTVHGTSFDATGASDTAADIAGEAKAAVSDLAGKAKQGAAEAAEHVKGIAEEKKAAGADRFKEIASAVSRAADALDDDVPQAAAFVRRAASGIDELADAVKERDIGEIVGIVHDYARRQPTIFLGATALAGFAAVRFFMTSAPRSSSPRSGGHLPQTRPVRSGYGEFERGTGGIDEDAASGIARRDTVS